MKSNNVVFHSIISSIQKVVLYETKNKLFLIGSNNRETRFRQLIIDRTVPDRLAITEDPHEINAHEIKKYIGSLNASRVISAYGILGFIRFLEGYYLILVTKRAQCAFVGTHIIYTINDTAIIRVNDTSGRITHPHEQKYLKMFCNIDLRSNFYFSYSYDLTRTMQHNASPPRYVGTNINIEQEEPLPNWNTATNNIQENNDRIDYAFRGTSRQRFIWNSFLLKPMQTIIYRDWLLEIIHGFVSQSHINILGRPIYICLIARRSARFAGTRFLKRGANFAGDVANEVETEQIVMDGNRICSFTQMRGSIPSHWSQDISKMVPKPPISLDLSDPFAQTSSKHFERLIFHFGAPIIVLNLVKEKEKREHESILSKEMISSIDYLNQFLPPMFRMRYIHFDMARKSRSSENVMESLANISEEIISRLGLFSNDQDEKCRQTGIVRVNCVDCLDRTNTAQFAIGKCVLGHQLCKLGVLNPPKLEFDSDCVTMLENLYEEHGDTLALQYGGSQLVHRIKTYRKTAVWASQGNDIMQTLSRYLSNTFSDTEKQHSINLFLGYYVPSENATKQLPAIWELQRDSYINTSFSVDAKDSHRAITDWISSYIRKSLPFSCSNKHKIVRELYRVHAKDFEMIDSYSNFHLSFKFTSLGEHIAHQINLLSRNFMPTYRTNFSPFQAGRRVERLRLTTGTSSTNSTSSTSSSMDEDSSSETENKVDTSGNMAKYLELQNVACIMPTMKDVYGCTITNPKTQNMLKYKQYVQVGKLAYSGLDCSTSIDLEKKHFSFNCRTTGQPALEGDFQPKINVDSLQLYEEYIVLPERIANNKQPKSVNMINEYLLSTKIQFKK